MPPNSFESLAVELLDDRSMPSALPVTLPSISLTSDAVKVDVSLLTQPTHIAPTVSDSVTASIGDGQPEAEAHPDISVHTDTHDSHYFVVDFEKMPAAVVTLEGDSLDTQYHQSLTGTGSMKMLAPTEYGHYTLLFKDEEGQTIATVEFDVGSDGPHFGAVEYKKKEESPEHENLEALEEEHGHGEEHKKHDHPRHEMHFHGDHTHYFHVHVHDHNHSHSHGHAAHKDHRDHEGVGHYEWLMPRYELVHIGMHDGEAHAADKPEFHQGDRHVNTSHNEAELDATVDIETGEIMFSLQDQNNAAEDTGTSFSQTVRDFQEEVGVKENLSLPVLMAFIGLRVASSLKRMGLRNRMK